ncbi:LLM class flavin-dependent oxidoreductase [Mycolicibacterium mucogenicum]|uniref:LLM class flavin-dependent oxidoreductase n=1 Tax=Mycolicibacterium mucogenicum TaxID=56689 RepID=UPI001EF95F35|nr:LLM class flavin-dependent oxidoreductase [Mycolicibacterium mucogenicum]
MTERARIDFPSRIGVWWASDSWAMPDAQAVARDIEAMGYGSLFLPETVGKECLTESAAFLAATDRLVVGTGIANIHVRLPSAAEAGARTLTALYPGRFVLGLGVSHGPLVERGWAAPMKSRSRRCAATWSGWLPCRMPSNPGWAGRPGCWRRWAPR